MRPEFYYHTENKPLYKDGSTVDYYDMILGSFQKFAKENNIAEDDYQVNVPLMGNVIRKTRRRLAQFEVFHDFGSSELPSELKEVALLAFWIIKLRPFTLLVERPIAPNPDNNDFLRKPINEAFARALIFMALERVLAEDNLTIECDGNLKKSMDYAFRFWDFTKEAFILFVEGIYYQNCSVITKRS